MIASGIYLRQHQALLRPFVERTYHESGLTYGVSPAGYDIRTRDTFVLQPGCFVCADALEEFDMPDTLLGVVHDKSTWARVGVACQNTVIEPGWRGVLRLEFSNHGMQTHEIAAGTPVAQVLFHFLDQAAEPYTGRYQDQKPGQDALFAK